MHPRLQLGLEYNPADEEICPVATLFVLAESSLRPAVFLGTSSDRIGSPRGTQAYYATAAKNLGSLPVAPYITLHYGEWDENVKVPFGAHIDLAKGFWLRPMYDGERTHMTGGYSRDRFSVTALYVWLEKPGVAVSFGF